MPANLIFKKFKTPLKFLKKKYIYLYSYTFHNLIKIKLIHPT